MEKDMQQEKIIKVLLNQMYDYTVQNDIAIKDYS